MEAPEIDPVIDANFQRIREKAEAEYKTIGEVYCPYFKGKITFNDKGLTHLKFKKNKFARERKDQYMRLKNIHIVPTVLKSSYTLQEYQVKKEFIDIATNTRKEKIQKDVYYYAFVAIIRDGNFDKRVKVVIRQVAGGIKMFWTIIPYWRSNRELKLHTGSLDED